jgi:2'-5' RNA ligase
MAKYSLWLIPRDKEYETFSEIITKFSKEYSLPVFKPHITLIHGLEMENEEIIAKTHSLAAFLSSFSVPLNGIECFDSSHKALIICAEKSSELLLAHQKAKEIFNHEEEEYNPHLSLAYGVYGNFSEEQKRRMIEQVGTTYPKVLMFDTISLFNTDSKNEEEWYKVVEAKLLRQ